ncbi:MAG: 1,4-beta-xylanase [Anaerolineae bacterium]|jgi:hypothetical protein|nr:1,4-beta-xylanase [Anaerolineae bacterium]
MTVTRWTSEQAQAWYAGQPWLRGCDFIPSTAINQLEMWQAETFDVETIDRELGWAEDLGFNSMRVYLHDLLWLQDAKGFKQRINQYLSIAWKHGISTLFVLFDDCWNDHLRLGKQPEPVPGRHNSGWVKSPGSAVLNDLSQWSRLEEYVKDIVSTFGQDERVVVWDVYNEPGNGFVDMLGLSFLKKIGAMVGAAWKHLFVPSSSEMLLKKAFQWAREANPIQPLTAGLWLFAPSMANAINKTCVEMSDVISFHSYNPIEKTQKLVEKLKQYGRPLICTEYMARTANCNFKEHLPYFKQEKIAAYNWGFVSGKTQTIYSWQKQIPSGEEPDLWFHDILRKDGSPYRQEEVDLIREVTKL